MSVSYLIAMLHDRVHRARTAPSRGASAVEWVIITAIVAGLAVIIAAVITNGVNDKADEIETAFNS
ncbi:hypothetical protein GCM10023194_02950 [Planotetraspora phitsanulokensis]|uniref:Pilus assembly protein Flp/PilA n=1 Tax=Planotetraspora phitsanulokensis TaxID=575192 RepID=A0A8J3XJH1_9ACTN|nr:hypothetical protein [Planotetraspora phitsanulokensis]GII43414.1 hypothetical protein Pph01_84170 [Planotetraspora phitsanulokensis]